ncbi:sugar ABC transporter substrate-binding protein [Antarcticimicrobium luteum]|uniref:Sugar ABC transporter substrate-binding protein n=1 Tax=Antarcticimicrobium luteum TaxID=2547397 RepID=A0A4R5V1S3_9RHOB|nr:sugar ABC transporter substrate-binding protein [Antarcticimicrobium luteum]TDK45712.1 sugar ABC transporter substrate-binding protein [Antarcticimicrobium luteum]
MTNFLTKFAGAAAIAAGMTAGAAQAQNVKLGVVAVNYNSPSIQLQADSGIARARELGWEVELFDGQGDQVATNNAAMAYIDRGFNAILNVASANTQMSGVIKYAGEKDVPFVSTFSGLVPGITADVGSNNTADGVIAATELVGRIQGEGHIAALNWNVLPALIERQRGLEAVMAGYPGVDITKVEIKVPGQVDDAYAQTTNLLLANDDIKAIWVGWDELAAPVARAIEQAGKEGEVFVVSQDGIPEVLELVRQGGPVELTVAYDVHRMGVVAVDVIDEALKGNMPSTSLLTLKPCLVTQDTAPAKGAALDFSSCSLFSGE